MAVSLLDLAVTRIGKAIAANSCEHLLWCLNHREDLFYQDKRKNNYLHYACTLYRPKVLYLLLTTDLNINAKNKSGNTPLHMTAIYNQSALVATLMMYGADPYIINNQGLRPCDIRTNNGSWKAVFRIYEPGMFGAVENGDADKLLDLTRKWCKTDVQKDGRTLRQWAARRGHHHLLKLMDKHKFTLECIYGVLEQNFDKFEKGVKKSGCHVNWLNQGFGHRHIIEYALEFGQDQMVSLLCDRGADLNLPVFYKKYIRMPLYFTILVNPAVPFSLIKQVVESGLDVKCKDEHGRNVVMFVLDRAPSNRLSWIVNHFLREDLDIADRDDTGASVRNIATLNDDKDVVASIDRIMIRLIRGAEMGRLWRMAEDGYDDFFFEHLWKDSFIYAAGNDSNDVTEFLTLLQSEYQKDVQNLHTLIVEGGRLKAVRALVDVNKQKEHLLVTKDRAGRSPLTKAVISGDMPMMEYLLNHDVCQATINTRRDNLNRSCLHYAYGMIDNKTEGELIVELLLSHGADITLKDVFGRSPIEYASGKAQSQLLKEVQLSYGLDVEMHLLKKYKGMRKIITSKKTNQRKYKKFLKLSRNLWYPMSGMSKALTPRGIPLVKNYRDLLFIAIEERQSEIAKKIVYLRADCNRREWVRMEDDDRITQKLMTSSEYAHFHKLYELSEYINKYQRTKDKQSSLFHRALTEINDNR